jgi:hypothetical protein
VLTEVLCTKIKCFVFWFSAVDRRNVLLFSPPIPMSSSDEEAASPELGASSATEPVTAICQQDCAMPRVNQHTGIQCKTQQFSR